VSQDQDPKAAAPSKREGPNAKALGAPRIPAPSSPSSRGAAVSAATPPAAESPPIAPEVEEVSGALLIDDSSPDIQAEPPAPMSPARQVSKPPPPPLSRMTAGGTLRPAPAPSRPALPTASQPPLPAPSQPALSAPTATGPNRPATDPAPHTRPFSFAVAETSKESSPGVPLEPPTERSLPSERESALRLPRAWGGVAAGAVRDAMHKAGDSLRPAAHALRDAVPKIRESLHPAANAIRNALPKIVTESLRSPPSMASLASSRWVLPASAVGGLLLGIGLAVPTGILLRRSSGRPAADPASPVASAGAMASPSALGAPPEREGALISCKLAGPPRSLATNATVAAGVEARVFGSEFALGYASSDTDGVVLRVDPSLTVLATVAGTSKGPIRRVSPVTSIGGAIGIAIDADRKSDVIRSRRTISLDPPLQVGVSASNLVWTQRVGGPVSGKLWPVEGRGEIDSIRSAASEVAGEPSLALVFRRKSAVGVGLVRGGDAPAPRGPLAYFDGLGPAVGSPAVGLNDGVVLAAWADRAGAEAAWSVRLARFNAGGPPEETRTFAPPAGGTGGPAMSPAIASLPQKGFLLIWSEGPPAGRRVRAVALAGSGKTNGPAIDLSSAGANAGQAQAAVASSGKGVVAFLQSAGSGFELVATPIACGM